MPAAYEWSDEEREDICARYLDGESATSIAKSYNVTHPTICSWLRKWGVQIRGATENSRLYRGAKYQADHTFFERIDTEAKAYWLGFILADGCITVDYRLAIHLHHSDVDHLYKLRVDIKSTHPICIRENNKGDKYCEFVICSFCIYESLLRLGIKPRKSGKETHISVPNELERHYWRGVIDGDGHIRKGAVNLIGSKNVVQAFRKYVKGLCPSFDRTIENYQPSEGVHYLWVRKPFYKAVLSRLYCNASVYLERKHELAMSLLRTQ